MMQIIRSSNSTEDLLTQIARACLLTQNGSAIESLAVSQHLEYSHPRIVQAVLLGVETPEGPWWQPLEGGWKYLRPLWRRPLKAALRSAAPGHAALARAAHFYLQHKMPEKSVPLYMEIGELSKAAEVMDHVADRMMDLGQWELLRSWINKLPAPVLHQWPWLVYAGSEMVASQGDLMAARRAFGKTISLFKDRQELPGICQSLLAECALAVQDSDWDGAVASAQEALHWAETGALYWYIIWANWALGYLYLKADRYDSAQPCFVRANEAAVSLANIEVIHLTDMMTRLILTKETLSQEIEQHRLEYLELESKEKAVVNQIQYLMQDTHGYVTELLETCGWSNIPLTLKLPVETVKPQRFCLPPPSSTDKRSYPWIPGFFPSSGSHACRFRKEVPIALVLKPDEPVKDIPRLSPPFNIKPAIPSHHCRSPFTCLVPFASWFRTMSFKIGQKVAGVLCLITYWHTANDQPHAKC
jgi:tetratricopeptide (TPR) repeat protein